MYVSFTKMPLRPSPALPPFPPCRIMQTLAVLCLQRPLTAAYVLKIPRLIVSVLKVTKQWQSNTSSTEDQHYLMPGDSIGLLIALLLVAEAQPKSSSDVTADDLSKSLISALIQLKTDVFSAYAAVGRRKDGLGHILHQDSHGSKDDLTQMKKHSTFLAPKGLLQSLRVITSENGGASSLRSSVALKGKEGGGAGRISAVRALQVWAADILSSPPDRVVKKGLMLPAITTIQLPETLKVIDGSEEEKREMGRGVEHLKDNQEEQHHKAADDQTIPVETEDEDEGSAEKAGKDTVEEEEYGGGEIEELRRLVKALQSILQGFTTSKID